MRQIANRDYYPAYSVKRGEVEHYVVSLADNATLGEPEARAEWLQDIFFPRVRQVVFYFESKVKRYESSQEGGSSVAALLRKATVETHRMKLASIENDDYLNTFEYLMRFGAFFLGDGGYFQFRDKPSWVALKLQFWDMMCLLAWYGMIAITLAPVANAIDQNKSIHENDWTLGDLGWKGSLFEFSIFCVVVFIRTTLYQDRLWPKNEDFHGKTVRALVDPNQDNARFVANQISIRVEGNLAGDAFFLRDRNSAIATHMQSNQIPSLYVIAPIHNYAGDEDCVPDILRRRGVTVTDSLDLGILPFRSETDSDDSDAWESEGEGIPLLRY